ncbi:MAG TPA: FlgD immunoglobulin-like domain containing protein [Pyrinomonadaceae bacterium]
MKQRTFLLFILCLALISAGCRSTNSGSASQPGQGQPVAQATKISEINPKASGVEQNHQSKKEDGPESKQSSQGLSIFDVNLSSPSFNPSRGDKVELRYNLSVDSKVTVSVYDADQQLVKVLVSDAQRKAGENKEWWDGKDLDGKLVANEAYFFCIESKDNSNQTVVYDPTTFSGGESADIAEGQANPESGTVNYKLSQPARVLMRAGIPGSALLKTVVDWEPRPAGEVTEYWNGKDEDGLIDIWNLKDYRLVLTYMTLPDATVITFGNNKYNYHDYKTSLKAGRPQKESRPMSNLRKLSPHFLKSRITDRAFKVRLVFPELDQGQSNTIPSVKDHILVRVDVPDKDRHVLLNQQYEIILLVDTAFHAEEERGYLPFNFPWELKDLPPGEHLLTVNIVTSGDQIGVGSRRIRVVK